eukprot:365390-Chlamydomonas_euryale.AAC.12
MSAHARAVNRPCVFVNGAARARPVLSASLATASLPHRQLPAVHWSRTHTFQVQLRSGGQDLGLQLTTSQLQRHGRELAANSAAWPTITCTLRARRWCSRRSTGRSPGSVRQRDGLEQSAQ